MSSLFRSRLFRQQFLVSACLTAVLFGILVAGIFLRTRSAIEGREKEIAGVYRDSMASFLSNWLGERKSDLEYLAASLEEEASALLSSPGPDSRLRLLAEHKTAFSDAILAGTDGYVRANRAGNVTDAVFVGDREYFREAMAGREFVSGVLRNRLTGEYDFVLSRPVRYRGETAAVVIGTVSLSDMSAIVRGANLQDLGSAYVIDADRRLVAGSVSFLQAEKRPAKSPPPVLENRAAELVAAGQVGAGRYRDEAGRTVVGAYGWFPELSLGIIVELRNARALLPVTRLMTFSAVFSVGMLLALLVLAYLQSARLVRPIQQLADAAETLEARSYADVDIRATGTELDILIGAFNDMARAVRDRERNLRENAARDSLTGLYNHAKIMEYLNMEMRRKKREGGIVCFVMLDIDHFKVVNDNFGHQAGDAILREVARMLVRLGREGDIVGRYGGEEFAVILNARGVEETGAYCDRIRKAVESLEFAWEGHRIRVTVSLGYACVCSSSLDSFDIVKIADRALYAAKEGGRNLVVAGSGGGCAEGTLP